MDASDTGIAVTILAGVFILLGIAGVVVPAVPGLVLSWLGVLVWAIFAGGGITRWIVLAIVSVLSVIGLVTKYSWPHRRLRATGVPMRSVVVGAVFGIIGFFAIPIVGLVLGFVLGVYVAEWVRLADAKDAWPSAKTAIKAVGLALIIELFAALTIGLVWVVGVVIA